jgi:phage tail-like protein
MENTSSQAITTFFHISIAGLPKMQFESCEGLEVEIEVVHFPEGGKLSAPRTGRGPQRVQKISFTHGTLQGEKNASQSLFKWFQEVCDASKPLEKRAIFLKLTDGEDNLISEWVINNAWPCRWAAPLATREQSEVAVEYVSFAHEGIEGKS